MLYLLHKVLHKVCSPYFFLILYEFIQIMTFGHFKYFSVIIIFNNLGFLYHLKNFMIHKSI